MDLGLSERLFIGAVLAIPKERRPWSIVSWLAEILRISRPTLYSIGEWTKARLLSAPVLPMITVLPLSDDEKAVAVTSSRMKRTALALLLPGGVSNRSAGVCLQSAFDEGRSPASLSALVHEAGKRAGKILQKVDHSVLGEVVQARDELFVGREPILLVITGLYATADRDAETWGCVLLFTRDRRVKIKGLAEDGCIPYAASCKAAKLGAAIQKLKLVEQLEKRLWQHWHNAAFDEWVELNEQFDRSTDCVCGMNAYGMRSSWLIGAAVRALNRWLADETLKGIKQLPHLRIQKLTERLENQLPEMLTFLDGIAQPLVDWQTQAEQHFQDHSAAICFQNSVARLWRLEHALRNGQKKFNKAALEAQQWLVAWIEGDPQIQALAEKLLNLLERTVRTSCAVETINSVLRPYFDCRRECTDLNSRQLFLNLFALWFNRLLAKVESWDLYPLIRANLH